MKTRIAMMAVIIMMAIQFSAAQEPATKVTSEEKIISCATKNLTVALHSTNPGVLEAAMRVTSQLKMKYPSAHVPELIAALNKIWQYNPSGTMRYKAYISMAICENPEWFSGKKSIGAANEDTFFHTASARLQEQLLSENLQ